MASVPCRVAAGAMVQHSLSVEDGLDAAAHAARGLRLFRPDRLRIRTIIAISMSRTRTSPITEYAYVLSVLRHGWTCLRLRHRGSCKRINASVAARKVTLASDEISSNCLRCCSRQA